VEYTSTPFDTPSWRGVQLKKAQGQLNLYPILSCLVETNFSWYMCTISPTGLSISITLSYILQHNFHLLK